MPKDKASSSEINKVIDLKILETDPSRIPPISSYHPDLQDDVRKAYLKKGLHQPVNFDFPWTNFGKQRRRFGKHWFGLHNWLEYCESSDSGYCLPFFYLKMYLNMVGITLWGMVLKIGKTHKDCHHMSLILIVLILIVYK